MRSGGAAADPSHELAHLRRRDLFKQVAASLVIALHWFNPLAWWAARRMRVEGEMAVDARVLRWRSEQEASESCDTLPGTIPAHESDWVPRHTHKLCRREG